MTLHTCHSNAVSNTNTVVLTKYSISIPPSILKLFTRRILLIMDNNNNFIVQFIEWKYILHFGCYIKTQYLSHVVMQVYSKIKYINI